VTPRTFNGLALRRARQARGMTAAQLAALVGRSQWVVYRVETDRTPVPVDLADAFALAVGVSLDDLLYADPLAEAVPA
jgi:transcriptional regulator with XRE-family HTH domain